MASIAVRPMKLITGEKSVVRRVARSQRDALRRATEYATSYARHQYIDDKFVLAWGAERRSAKVGIHLHGSCDLPAVFSMLPQIRASFQGTCAMIKSGLVSDARTDLLLQSLAHSRNDDTSLIAKRLHLKPDHFHPTLFESTFAVRGPFGKEVYKKDVVIMSIAADVTRSVFRHKTSGLLVDPGGWWLASSMDSVLKDLDTARWFKSEFEPLGRISVDQSMRNFTSIIGKLRESGIPNVVMFNVLTVEPGVTTHNYQVVRDPQGLRRREFNTAIMDLSKELGVGIVDVDRVLKESGVVHLQVDFGHYPPQAYKPIGQATMNVLRDMEILKRT